MSKKVKAFASSDKNIDVLKAYIMHEVRLWTNTDVFYLHVYGTWRTFAVSGIPHLHFICVTNCITEIW